LTKRILITGGSGLFALNYSLAIRERYPITLGMHERNISLQKVNTEYLSLDRIDDLLIKFNDLKPEIVIHAAGLTNVEQCEAKPIEAEHININLTENIANACVKNGAKLVLISTDHLFSGDTPLVDESHNVMPMNTYARTKAKAEEVALSICNNSLIIRTNFYGWGLSYRSSFSDMIISALRNNKELTLFKDVFYTPILIETLANSVIDLIRVNASGIFHIVGDERISKYEFGMSIAKHFNLDPTLIRSGTLASNSSLVKRPLDMSLSNKKICKLLGKNLGGVNVHIQRLIQQEKLGHAKELKSL